MILIINLRIHTNKISAANTRMKSALTTTILINNKTMDMVLGREDFLKTFGKTKPSIKTIIYKITEVKINFHRMASINTKINQIMGKKTWETTHFQCGTKIKDQILCIQITWTSYLLKDKIKWISTNKKMTTFSFRTTLFRAFSRIKEQQSQSTRFTNLRDLTLIQTTESHSVSSLIIREITQKVQIRSTAQLSESNLRMIHL